MAEKPPPPGWGKIFWHQIYPFQAIYSNFGFCGRKAPPPSRIRENFLTLDLSISGNFKQLWFLWQKSLPPPRMRENFLTSDLSNSGNFEQLWFLWQKSPPPPGWGKIFWHQIYPFQQFQANFPSSRGGAFLPQKSKLLEIVWNYSFHEFLSNFGFCGRKAPPLQDKRKFFDIRSIHFRQFQATLVFVAEKPPPQGWGKIFWHQIYPIQAILSNFGFCGRKAPPPPGWGKIFWHQIYPFQQFQANFPSSRGGAFLPQKSKLLEIVWNYSFHEFLSNFGFCGRKAPPLQDKRKFFDIRSIHFRQFQATLVFVAEKPPPPKDEGNVLTPDLSTLGNFEQLWFLWQKSPPPRMRENFLTPDLSISGNFKQLWFLWQKSPPPPPPRMREKFLTSDLSISGNFEQLWFLWQKSPPPPHRWGKFLWHQIYPIQAILSNFGFCGRKAPPPPLTGWGKNFWHQIYPFHAISSNFGFCGRKAFPTQDEGKNFDTRSIHFRQFQATLVFVAEKPPPPRWGKLFWHQIDPIQASLSNFGFCGRKAPPPHSQDEGNFLTSDLSISGNFEQLWFLWQKSLPHPGWGKKFWHQIYPFQAISSNFGFCGRKASPPHPLGWGKNFWHQIYPIQAILSRFGFCGRKAPPPARMRGKFLTPDLSNSGNFEQLWFLWQKSAPPGWGNNIWHQIYPLQAILSNFGFCGRIAPPLPGWGEIFWHQIYPIQAISSKFGFCGRKAPPPRMRENFLTPDLSISAISSKFSLIWGGCFSATKIKVAWNCLKLSISGNFEQLWFLWQKSPPPFSMRENFLTPDLSISGNFEQLWLLWQKSTPPDEGNFFDTRSIHFRQFWATLVFVAEKPPLQDKRKFFDIRSIHFRQFQATLVFVAEKPPPPKDEGKIFDIRSIQFRQFWATLIFVAEKPPSPGWGKIFWHQIYPFQQFQANFPSSRGGGCFCATKIKVARNCLKLFISRIFEQLWFLWQKSPPPLQHVGKTFDTRSIHFRKFWATLICVAEKPPPPRMRENFLTPDLSISGNFEQLWFCGRKAPPLPHTPGWGKIFWHQIYPIQAILSNFGFVAEKPPPPTPRIREKFLTSDLSISGNFEQLWFLWQ